MNLSVPYAELSPETRALLDDDPARCPFIRAVIADDQDTVDRLLRADGETPEPPVVAMLEAIARATVRCECGAVMDEPHRGCLCDLTVDDCTHDIDVCEACCPDPLCKSSDATLLDTSDGGDVLPDPERVTATSSTALPVVDLDGGATGPRPGGSRVCGDSPARPAVDHSHNQGEKP